MKTRTVALTPIKSDVQEYLKYLASVSLRVVSVVWPTLPGRDVKITFEVNE